ncbi:CDP-glycerol glycerophosphotransferase family protein [Heyndrickxia oleronia]|uniref:CDP-glycerol glycerophosphotransferase family protein n=1 Tax=Heyndrickxia oleronia TaxID=38875 RepID=A0AAW6SXG2_9BACI|nr:CDP-glycerol glycerophosphotransferase family protein [Heyndrickxia oleronia]MDH5161284.1 CDP-glycerol glycerophosphotransferase family protein [Heyndrickxia oleronia]
MRLQVRNKLLELLPTIMEGIQYVKKADAKNALPITEDCLLALHSIRETLKKSLSEGRFQYYNEIITKIEKIFDEMIIDISEGRQFIESAQSINNILYTLNQSLQEESEVKLEILFLPYKSSMWDSLESIWLAAKDDPSCDCYVMPIPYYDRDDHGKLSKFHYEGEQFPNYVPITSYQKYNIVKRRPDIIYFHNPYDGYNYVTSVAPEYYSNFLKQYTDMLVYVPYFIAGAYRNAKDAASKCLAEGVLNASRIIVQSEVLKDIYIQNGIDPEKVIALGSPKIDAILNYDKYTELPAEWKRKINGKKVVLLNSSIGRLLNEPNYMIDLEKNIKTILNNKEIVLLWRPHPLFEATIKSMRKEYLTSYLKIKNHVFKSDNGIFDESKDASYSIIASDGMISDNSSLIRTYIMIGKPILIMESSKDIKQEVMLSCDIYSCYFYNNGVTVESFLEMIIENRDSMREKRISDYKNSLVNTDGSCGFKIHSNIIKELL